MSSQDCCQLIDSEGFRHNVGIVLCNRHGEVFWARRVGRDVWQFPQGGIQAGESPEQAMFRELREEIGLTSCHVDVLGATQGWLRYRLPKRLIRHDRRPLCIGQKQIWFMLRLTGSDDDVCLNLSPEPEFDHWRWVHHTHPLKEVVFFKRKVYERALGEFATLIKRAAGGGSRTARPLASTTTSSS